MSVKVNISLGSNAKTKHLFLLLQSEEANAEDPRKQLELLALVATSRNKKI